MNVVIALEQKECRISISHEAQQTLEKRIYPLVAEVVVTLACCICKKVAFRDALKDEKLLLATPLLAIELVSDEHRTKREDSSSYLTPIRNWNAIAPRWITIDFQNGVWRGDFGYRHVGEHD
jgi:hypothetical protein